VGKLKIKLRKMELTGAKVARAKVFFFDQGAAVHQVAVLGDRRGPASLGVKRHSTPVLINFGQSADSESFSKADQRWDLFLRDKKQD
jgi:hypothetical protein